MKATAQLLLTLAGARPYTPDQLSAFIQRIPSETWSEILIHAERSRIAGLIDAYLYRQGVLDQIPKDIQDQLLTIRRRNLAEYHRQVHALARISQAFRTATVEFRVLKGAAIASYYPDPTARAVGDLDLWVCPHDVGHAISILDKLEMIPITDVDRPLAFRIAFDKEQEFQPRSTMAPGAILDLHWHLTSPWWVRKGLLIPESDIFHRFREVIIGGQTYGTLETTDTLFYLCLSAGIGDQFQNLRTFMDIAQLLQVASINWKHLNTRMTSSKTTIVIEHCLALLDLGLGTNYSDRLVRKSNWLHRKLVQMLLPTQLNTADNYSGIVATWPIPLQRLILLPDTTTMLSSLQRLIWPPPDWIRLRYTLSPNSSSHRVRLVHLWQILRSGEVIFH